MRVKTGVILAAGEGRRLDILDYPKPLVRVGNKPLILWNIEQMQEAGVKEIFIVLGFRGEEIKKELSGNPAIKIKLNFVWQKDSTKKGILKALMALEGLIKDSFFLTMADLVIEKNPYKIFYSKMRNIPGDAIVSLVDARDEQFERCGALSKIRAESGIVKAIGRELKDFNALEVGVYYFGKKSFGFIQSLFDIIKSLFKRDIEIKNFDDLLRGFVSRNKLRAIFLEQGEWFDINTPATRIRAEIFAQNFQLKKRVPQKRRTLSKTETFSRFSRHKTMKTDIIIKRGLIDDLRKIQIIPKQSFSAPHFILTDSIVDKLYGNKVLKGFLKAGYNVKKLVVPAGEGAKSISEYSRLADEIFSYGMNKHSHIVSLGGGVVNNIAGFLASTLYRGINLIHFPTTTMAQVDAAIDFKQAINSIKGKNLLGSYYPASAIAIDPNVLKTLSFRHINNGFAESIKHALTQDKNFLQYLDKNYQKIKKKKDIKIFDYIIRQTIEMKVPLLDGDAKDDYNEMLPQYGHSIGHAVEQLSSYNLLHGEALAIGMCVCAEISKIVGVCNGKTVEAHYDICKKYNLPVMIPDYMSVEDIFAALHYDKHFVKGHTYMALVEKPGKVWHEKRVYGVPIDFSIIRKAIMENKNKKRKYAR
jgi:3-dehydroquinate synthase